MKVDEDKLDLWIRQEEYDEDMEAMPIRKKGSSVKKKSWMQEKLEHEQQDEDAHIDLTENEKRANWESLKKMDWDLENFEKAKEWGWISESGKQWIAEWKEWEKE